MATCGHITLYDGANNDAHGEEHVDESEANKRDECLYYAPCGALSFISTPTLYVQYKFRMPPACDCIFLEYYSCKFKVVFHSLILNKHPIQIKNDICWSKMFISNVEAKPNWPEKCVYGNIPTSLY